jgi:hypothetical protein
MLAAKVFPAHVHYPDPVIHAVIFFAADASPTEHDILHHVVHPLLQYQRLSHIPVLDEAERLSFEPGSYDPKRLIRRFSVKSDTEDADTDAALFKIIQEHLHDALDDPHGRGRLPWWEILLIDSGTGSSHKSAFVWRIHHALGDGISLATVIQNILTLADGSPIPPIIPPGMMEQRAQSTSRMPWYTLAWKVWYTAFQVLSMPHTKPDDPTLFSKHIHYHMVHTRHSELVLFPTLPLDFIKAIKNKAQHDITINDVLLTCLSLAIHDYLQEEHCPVLRAQGANLQCRALIAAGLPRHNNNPDDATTTAMETTLQNKWFLLTSDLAIGLSSSSGTKGLAVVERLHYLHHHLAHLKQSLIPMVGLALQNYLCPILPRPVNEWLFCKAMTHRSLSFSNVPGPAQTCWLAHQPAVGVQIFQPNIIPHVGFISYAGQIFGNITLDPTAIPNSHSLSLHFHKAVIALAEQLDVPVPQELKL